MEDLAECAVDEVLEVMEMDPERASALIMTAREPPGSNRPRPSERSPRTYMQPELDNTLNKQGPTCQK